MNRSGFQNAQGVFGYLVSAFLLFLLSAPVWGGNPDNPQGIQPPPPGPLPPARVQPLPSDAPAPWGTDPATLPGVKVEDTIKGNGFLQETITLQNKESFFFQSITTSDFSVDSYVKRSAGIDNNPEGNLIFNQNIKDPAWGLTDHTFMNGFKQPIQLHFDIVESKVAKLTSGFNQMDMHFRQIPFLDTATGRIRNRQDIGIWITSIAGIMPSDATTDQRWTPTERTMSHRLATTIGNFSGEDNNGADVQRGAIDFWNDFEVVKITDAATNQLVTFSRCNDFADPTGAFDEHFRNDLGSRRGCSGGTGRVGQITNENGSNTFRPPIPAHDLDSFQLTPLNWERWGGGGKTSITGSGGNGGFGGTTTFPNPTNFQSDGFGGNN